METLGEGVAPEVNEAVRAAARHFEALGATVEEVGAGRGLPGGGRRGGHAGGLAL